MIRMFMSLFACSFAALVHAAPTLLYPSGDPVIDQPALLAALQSAGSDESATIKLSEGTFYLQGGITVTGFNGTLAGSGADRTTIVALGDGDPANDGSVLQFVDGSATIIDLSIEVPDFSRYLDDSPNLAIANGGAAIDVLGGSATIRNVQISANGPFLGLLDPDSLEHGVLVRNCTGTFELSGSYLHHLKRAFVFAPHQPSACNIRIADNRFEDTRSAIALLGGVLPGFAGNSQPAEVWDNALYRTLVTAVQVWGLDYEAHLKDNVLRPQSPGGNCGLWADGGTAPVLIAGNDIQGQYALGGICIWGQTGGVEIRGNRVDGSALLVSVAPLNGGAITIELSDQVLSAGNDFRKNTLIPGWSVPELDTPGAYYVRESTNVVITEDRFSKQSLAACQVLHLPAIDATTFVDASLVSCSAALP